MKALLLLLASVASFVPLRAQEGAGKTAEAELPALEQQLKVSPDSMRLLSASGDAALFAGQAAKAVEHFERMIKLDPAQDAPHWRLGIAYYFNKQWAESARQFEKYHAHDARDRENGIWKFLADAKRNGIERARAEMLPYEQFDREPFPALYDMYAGRMTPEEFRADVEQRGATSERRAKFFALYYDGLFQDLLGQREAGIEKVRQAVALYTPATAGSGGPGYMWRVAGVHLEFLQAAQK